MPLYIHFAGHIQPQITSSYCQRVHHPHSCNGLICQFSFGAPFSHHTGKDCKVNRIDRFALINSPQQKSNSHSLFTQRNSHVFYAWCYICPLPEWLLYLLLVMLLLYSSSVYKQVLCFWVNICIAAKGVKTLGVRQ